MAKNSLKSESSKQAKIAFDLIFFARHDVDDAVLIKFGIAVVPKGPASVRVTLSWTEKGELFGELICWAACSGHIQSPAKSQQHPLGPLPTACSRVNSCTLFVCPLYSRNSEFDDKHSTFGSFSWPPSYVPVLRVQCAIEWAEGISWVKGSVCLILKFAFPPFSSPLECKLQNKTRNEPFTKEIP